MHEPTTPHAAPQGWRHKVIFLGSSQRAAEVTTKMLRLYRMPVQDRADHLAPEIAARLSGHQRNASRSAPGRKGAESAADRQKRLDQASLRAASDWLAAERKKELDLEASRPAMQAAALQRERRLVRAELAD